MFRKKLGWIILSLALVISIAFLWIPLTDWWGYLVFGANILLGVYGGLEILKEVEK